VHPFNERTCGVKYDCMTRTHSVQTLFRNRAFVLKEITYSWFTKMVARFASLACKKRREIRLNYTRLDVLEKGAIRKGDGGPFVLKETIYHRIG
jgi:hypothetical protein